MVSSSETNIVWLSGETFFSLCSRLHLLYGSQSPRVTAQRLFNLSERCIKHDLPCALDAFERLSAGRWGVALHIMEQHTIIPFFAPFQSREAVDDAICRLRSQTIGSLKYQLGLVCGGFGADHPLKACVSCMRRDIEIYGVSYWHLDHQYPGAVICPVHAEALNECTQNHRWCGRFSWTLPDTGTLRDMGYGVLKPVEQQRLAQMCKACSDLAGLGLAQHFDPQLVAKAYRERLPNESAAQSLLAHLEPLRRFSPYDKTPDSLIAAGGFIGQMVRSPRRHMHPLKHLMMITWLYGDVSSFRDGYEKICTQSRTTPSPVNCIPKPFVSTTAQRKRGHPRPKRLKPDLRARLLDRLAEGTSKHQICDEFRITVSTVNKLLRMERGIQASWAFRRIANDLADHRLQWSDLRQRYPSLSINELRGQCAALYAWLHRNDRLWLDAQAALMRKPIRCQDSRVDWDVRDDCLLGQLKAEILHRYGSDQDLRLKQSYIFALVPRLAQRLERRDRYPKTKAYMKLISIR